MSVIALRVALLCLTCEALTDHDTDMCPACGYRGLVPLRFYIKPLDLPERPAAPGKEKS